MSKIFPAHVNLWKFPEILGNIPSEGNEYSLHWTQQEEINVCLAVDQIWILVYIKCWLNDTEYNMHLKNSSSWISSLS